MLRLLLPLLLLTACAPHRVLRVENGLLRQQNESLQERIHALEQQIPPGDAWAPDPDLETVHRWLEHAGYTHTWSSDARHVRLQFAGRNTEFGVNVQRFESARVLLLATDDYLHLDAATSPESLVLLLVQLAVLNYELLVGKFQVNPESGEVLLSVELPTVDGLGRAAFVQALEQLLHTADTRHPELQKAAAGLGL